MKKHQIKYATIDRHTARWLVIAAIANQINWMQIDEFPYAISLEAPRFHIHELDGSHAQPADVVQAHTKIATAMSVRQHISNSHNLHSLRAVAVKMNSAKIT